MAVTASFSDHARNNDQHNNKNDEGQPTENAAAALSFGSSFTGSFIFATDRFADQIDACRQPSLIIASPKQWLDMTLSDVECRRVRQRAFHAVADLDNHLAVLDERKKNHTITPLLLADAPRLCHALCVIGDIRVALHFRKN